jgi:hypothetical protein
MKDYAQKYGDFNLHDGTHSVNRYGEILLPSCVVDALGRTKISSIMLMDSENSDELLDFCSRLGGLFKEGSTYMTDEGPAFAVVAEALGLEHLLCVDHWTTSIFSGTAGLGEARLDFIREMNRLIFEDLGSTKNLECLLGVAALTYKSNPAATALIAKIDAKKSQVCFTETKKHFTAGHRATQRAEGANSMIKERGELKKDLKMFNNFQLVTHLLSMAETKDLDAVHSLVKLLEKGHDWSPYVHDRWTAAQQACSSIQEMKRVSAHGDLDGLGPGTVWSVKTRSVCALGATDHTVKTWINHEAPNARSRQPPTCDCAPFTSSHLPCAHICHVFTCSRNTLFVATNLYHRWRLCSMPLWGHSKRKLNFVPGATGESAVMQPGDLSQLEYVQEQSDVFEQVDVGVAVVPLADYEGVHYSDKKAKRVMDARQKCMQLADLLAQSNEHAYKLGMAGVATLMNHVREVHLNHGVKVSSKGADGKVMSMLSTTIQPKVKRKKSTVADEASAMSALNSIRNKAKTKKTRETLGACKDCLKHATIATDRHRASSTNCPFKHCMCRLCSDQADQLCRCDGCQTLPLTIQSWVPTTEQRGIFGTWSFQMEPIVAPDE